MPLMAKRGGAVHVVTTRRHYKDKVYETTLLRRSYREAGKVKTETLANLSHLPPEAIAAVRASLAGETLVAASEGFEVTRSLPHGHVAAVWAMAHELGLPKLLARPAPSGTWPWRWWWPGRASPPPSWPRRAGGPRPRSGPTWAWRGLRPTTSTGPWTGCSPARPASKPPWRVGTWPQAAGCSTTCPAVGWKAPIARWRRRGYSRDGKAAKAQVEYGLTCDPEGRPVAVEVFAGNTADPTAFISAAQAVRERFGLTDVVMVGDRGMITSARIAALRAVGGLGWLTSLRAPPSPPWPARGRYR